MESSGGVFGQASASNASNSSNPFASNTLRTSNFPGSLTQGSVFGVNATDVSLASSVVSSQSFSFGRAFGNTNSSQNQFASNAFGNASNSNHNPFAPNVLGNTSNSSHNPFALNAFGNTSNANNNAFGNISNANNNTFGNTNNSNNNPFGNTNNSNNNAFGNTTASLYGGHSTGVLGALSASSPSTSTSRQPATSSSSSSLFGPSGATSQGPFGSTISGGSIGGSSFSGFKQGSGSTASLFSPTPRSLTGGTSTEQFRTPSLAQKTGSRINPYKRTSEGTESLMSISAMPCYKSKSHEELRWEDYELKSRVSNQELGFKKAEFNFSFPSTTSSQSTQSSPFNISSFSKEMNATLPIPSLSSPNPSPNYSTLPTISAACTGPEINKGKSEFSFPSIESSLSTQSPRFNAPLFATNMNTPTLSFPYLSSPNPSPNFPAIYTKSTSSSTGPGYDQLGAGSLYNQPLQNLSLPSTTSGWQQVPSSLITVPIPTENNGGASLKIDRSQRSHSQQVKDSIIAVKDPFGSERATFQPSIGHSACSPLVQRGISSMPVADEKPAKTRVSSVLTSRHHSIKPLAVKVRKYHPSKDAPKVPFFDRAEDVQVTSKAHSYIVPRENPRSVVAASSELTGISTFTKEGTPPYHAFAEEYEQVSGNAKKDQISSFTPNARNDHFCEAKDSTGKANKISIPKLQRSDYYTKPKIDKLESIESINPGSCCHVKDFVVGRHGYGWVKFYGETDVRGLDLDSIIHFNNQEVIVYDEDSEKPPVGQGLNKAAEVTILNIKCIDKKTGIVYNSDKMVDNFIKKLKKVTENQGAEFISYDPIKEEWKFRVQHF